MAAFLKQSTQVIARFGPYLDKTDGVTEETGLAGGATEISKNHAAFGTGPTLGTHDAEGWYPITLTTTHTDTCGPLLVKAHDSATHLPVWREFYVVEEAVFDALYAASAPGYVSNAPVNVAQFGGSNGTFASGRPEVNTTHAAGTAWGSGAITAASIAASALNSKGNWNIDKTGYSLTQTFPANFASLAITAGGIASADIKAINATTVLGDGSATPWGP